MIQRMQFLPTLTERFFHNRKNNRIFTLKPKRLDLREGVISPTDRGDEQAKNTAGFNCGYRQEDKNYDEIIILWCFRT